MRISIRTRLLAFAVTALLAPAFGASSAAAVTWTADENETPAYSEFENVSCASSTDSCMAVGYQSDDVYSFFNVWAEYWDGSSWEVQNVAVPGGYDEDMAQLHAVSCPETDSCVAVGDIAQGANSSGTFASTWDGSSWTAEEIDDAGQLRGVSCTDTDACVAVGSDGNSAIAYEWDGTSWSEIALPAIQGALATGLHDVSCVAADNCTAVGGQRSTLFGSNTLIARWDGSAWTVQTSPNPIANASSLVSVSCSASNACTAVGNYIQTSPSYVAHTLVARWNGTSWTTQSAPDSAVQSVSCSASNACTAVGANQHLSWNGTTWTMSQSDDANDLYGVSCIAATDCVAVGKIYDYWTGEYSSLAMRSSS